MKDRTKISKLLAYVLRHRPDELDLELDPEGWTDVAILLERLHSRRGVRLSLAELEALAAADSKGRYSIRDGRIRANQGHSVDVQAVDLTPLPPPAALYHGTTRERWPKIRDSGGLRPMQRHHVHLTDELDVARQVGARHRKETPLVLRIDAAGMARDGHSFYRSENGVWMADSVPIAYLSEF